MQHTHRTNFLAISSHHTVNAKLSVVLKPSYAKLKQPHSAKVLTVPHVMLSYGKRTKYFGKEGRNFTSAAESDSRHKRAAAFVTS